jgi:hypothetical protein
VASRPKVSLDQMVAPVPESQSHSYTRIDGQSASLSVLVSGTHLGPATNFSSPFFNYF